MDPIICDNLTIKENQCFLNDTEIELTKNEYTVLKYFVENQNKVITREDILQNCWNKSVGERTVDTTISRVRSKLGEFGERIRTRTGFGYQFV